MEDGTALTRTLCAELGAGWSVQPLKASAFCATWRADRKGSAPFFIKALPSTKLDVLEAEADGLAALAATRTIRVPAVAGLWNDPQGPTVALALEWLTLCPPDARFGERLGRALGALHQAAPASGDGRFGWRRDNWLGGTPQVNHWSTDGGTRGWTAFVGEQRLGAMRDRLRAAGAAASLCDSIDAVIRALPRFFDDGHRPRSSLVHGDLWSGNWGMLPDGTPVIYDPAVSCSDAEAELAMTDLFGAPAGFREAYAATAGLHAGYARRRPLYQLYHLLNHALLFGGGYVGQSLALARSLA